MFNLSLHVAIEGLVAYDVVHALRHELNSATFTFNLTCCKMMDKAFVCPSPWTGATRFQREESISHVGSIYLFSVKLSHVKNWIQICAFNSHTRLVTCGIAYPGCQLIYFGNSARWFSKPSGKSSLKTGGLNGEW
jgi:hypothetical protein